MNPASQRDSKSTAHIAVETPQGSAAQSRVPTPPESATKSALKSMTGFAQARLERDDWLLRASVRSVNHRFLDLRLRLPEGFERFEPILRQLANERLRRGHVDITLRAEPLRQAPVSIHHDVAAAYLHAAEKLRREFGLSRDPDVAMLMRLPGVVAAAGASSSGDPALDDPALEALGRHISACVDEALARLNQMRQAEGQALTQEMKSLLERIAQITVRLEALAESSRPAYAQHLKTRIGELLGGAVLDPARLAQEAALLAERADVSEELARLRSHTAQFAQLIERGGEVGKKLDFLLQEMQREANTLLSKTPGLGPEGLAITDLGLEIKSEIEKLREQVQNVE